MSINVLIFEGGESINMDDVDSPPHVVCIPKWSQEHITETFIEYFGDEWAREEMDFCMGDPIMMTDTISIVNANLAQAVTDGSDGGMTYMVRIPT